MPPHAEARRAGLLWLIVPAIAFMLALVIVAGKPLYAAALVLAIVAGPWLLRSPQLALLCVIAAIPLEEAGVLSPDGPLGRLSLAKIFGAVALVSWLVNMIVRREPFHVPRAIWLLVLYLCAGLLSLFGATEVDAGRTMLFRWINTILFFLMVCNVIDSWTMLRRALVLFLVVSTAVSAFALAQRALPSLQYGQRGAAEIAEGVEFGAQIDEIEKDRVGSTVVRVGGTSYHPLILALNTTLLLPLLVMAVIHWRGRWRWIAGLALLIDVAALIATGSRSGIVSSVAVLLVLMIQRVVKVNRFVLLFGLLLPFLVVPMLPNDLRDRIFRLDAYDVERSSSLSYRVDMLQAGLSVWSDHPVLGVGLGNLTEIGPRMTSDVLVGLASGVHNMYVQVALETGVVGLGLIVAFFVSCLRAARITRDLALQSGRMDVVRLVEGLRGVVWVLLIYGMSLDVMNFSLKNAWFLLATLFVCLRLIRRDLALGPLPASPTTAPEGIHASR